MKYIADVQKGGLEVMLSVGGAITGAFPGVPPSQLSCVSHHKVVGVVGKAPTSH